MLRRISVLLMAVLLLFALTGNVALAQTEPDLSDKGQPGSNEEKKPGSPDNPDHWGSVVTQTAIPSEEEGVDAGTFGQHASDPPGDEPRKGLGNVARTDQGTEGTDDCGPENTDPTRDCDTGDNVSDHGCIADDPFRADCELAPGSTATGRA